MSILLTNCQQLIEAKWTGYKWQKWQLSDSKQLEKEKLTTNVGLLDVDEFNCVTCIWISYRWMRNEDILFSQFCFYCSSNFLLWGLKFPLLLNPTLNPTHFHCSLHESLNIIQYFWYFWAFQNIIYRFWVICSDTSDLMGVFRSKIRRGSFLKNRRKLGIFGRWKNLANWKNSPKSPFYLNPVSEKVGDLFSNLRSSHSYSQNRYGSTISEGEVELGPWTLCQNLCQTYWIKLKDTFLYPQILHSGGYQNKCCA